MTDWTRKTAAQMADALAAGEVTSVSLTQAHLDRIAAVDGGIEQFRQRRADRLHIGTMRLGFRSFGRLFGTVGFLRHGTNMG